MFQSSILERMRDDESISKSILQGGCSIFKVMVRTRGKDDRPAPLFRKLPAVNCLISLDLIDKMTRKELQTFLRKRGLIL